MACSTCHVIVPADWFARLPEASEEEEDMLDLAAGVQRTSRLSCQIDLTEEMDGLEGRVSEALRAGQEPEEALAEQYNDTFGRLQTNASYQRLVAAQSNFDKVLMRVNETITRGLEEGGESRIILPS